MTTYIYGLLDPSDGKLRYVGKTINPVSRRREHFKTMQNRIPQHGITARFREWATGLRTQGLEPAFVILEQVEIGWEEAERRWIRQMREAGHPLFNCFDGGQPGSPPRKKEADPLQWWSPERGFYTPDSVAP